LTVEYPGEIPQTILTDGARVRQALINLVGNAVKFTEHGRVRIVASFVQEWQDGRSALKIEVIDTGIGIREEVLSQLFQPFFQGEAAVAGTYGGTGLGLAISRHIAAMLGGDLTAQSVWGEGSCFTLTIPTGDLQGVRILKGPLEEQERPSQEERREANVSLRGARILLAEDGYDNRELIRAVLGQAGAAVETAEDGGIAVEMAQSKSFDVVLMDMNMPVMDGFEATRLLRSRGYSGPILALTANAMAEDRERCRMAGCSEFLAKPIDRAQLIETIAKHIHGGEPLVETPPSSCSVDPLPSCRGGETVPIVSEYAGDPVIAEILGPFIENLPTQVEAMQIARVNGRCDEVQRLAHQLKGAGGGYGFPMLSAASQILEDAARAGNLALGDAAIQQIGVLVEAIQKGYSAAAPAKNATS
jgi:CheY-like chemotaxis protein/HPt (histidine-containing phosphotransfer) domain-containing protein